MVIFALLGATRNLFIAQLASKSIDVISSSLTNICFFFVSFPHRIISFQDLLFTCDAVKAGKVLDRTEADESLGQFCGSFLVILWEEINKLSMLRRLVK
jgi:hypothetical protein